MRLAGLGAVTGAHLLEYWIPHDEWPRAHEGVSAFCTTMFGLALCGEFQQLRPVVKADVARLAPDTNYADVRICIYRATGEVRKGAAAADLAALLAAKALTPEQGPEFLRLSRRLWNTQVRAHEKFHAWLTISGVRKLTNRTMKVGTKVMPSTPSNDVLDRLLERAVAQAVVEYWAAQSGQELSETQVRTIIRREGARLKWARTQRSIAEEFVARIAELRAIEEEAAELRRKAQGAAAQLRVIAGAVRAAQLNVGGRATVDKFLTLLATGVPAEAAEDHVRRPPLSEYDLVGRMRDLYKIEVKRFKARVCPALKPGVEVVTWPYGMSREAALLSDERYTVIEVLDPIYRTTEKSCNVRLRGPDGRERDGTHGSDRLIPIETKPLRAAAKRRPR